jgi:hypothetical protein
LTLLPMSTFMSRSAGGAPAMMCSFGFWRTSAKETNCTG